MAKRKNKKAEPKKSPEASAEDHQDTKPENAGAAQPDEQLETTPADDTSPDQAEPAGEDLDDPDTEAEINWEPVIIVVDLSLPVHKQILHALRTVASLDTPGELFEPGDDIKLVSATGIDLLTNHIGSLNELGDESPDALLKHVLDELKRPLGNDEPDDLINDYLEDLSSLLNNALEAYTQEQSRPVKDPTPWDAMKRGESEQRQRFKLFKRVERGLNAYLNGKKTWPKNYFKDLCEAVGCSSEGSESDQVKSLNEWYRSAADQLKEAVQDGEVTFGGQTKRRWAEQAVGAVDELEKWCDEIRSNKDELAAARAALLLVRSGVCQTVIKVARSRGELLVKVETKLKDIEAKVESQAKVSASE